MAAPVVPASASGRVARAALQSMPNVGPATAEDLIRLGIRRPDGLIGRDGDHLYAELCRLDGRRHDPCVRDVLAAAIAFAEGGPPRPWWEFTPARKERDARSADPLAAER
ncbi:MAG TPA: helix-hairpin-helix domain-containing protein [Acidimicrobiales bacterium]